MIAIGRILVLDDSAMMRMVLRKSLSMAKVQANEIVEASDGQEALRLLQSGLPFDLMFCDLNMPGMTGDELIAELMKTTGLAIPPIVIVSAEATPERIERLQSDRIVGVLRKPFSPEMIAKLVSESKVIGTKEIAV